MCGQEKIMSKNITIAAFGALNQASYEAFGAGLEKASAAAGVSFTLRTAVPYPNAAAVSAPSRPLRGEALQDDIKKQQLYDAVASDAREIGAAQADICCMPCMSMIGFHDGVAAALGLPILRLSDALTTHYKDVQQLGVIHMRPAKQRIIEIFGARAVTPDENQAALLLAAEDAAKQSGSAAGVEAVMADITTTWRDQGIARVLFARADAPKAHMGQAGQIEGILIENYFDILAAAVMNAKFAGSRA
jgi:hypothetical protein